MINDILHIKTATVAIINNYVILIIMLHISPVLV